MTPVEFSEEEMATFRKKHAFKTASFWIITLSFKQTDMTRKKTKFCLSWPNKTLKISGRLQNIAILLTERTIMPYSNLILLLSVSFYRMWRHFLLDDSDTQKVPGVAECSPPPLALPLLGLESFFDKPPLSRPWTSSFGSLTWFDESSVLFLSDNSLAMPISIARSSVRSRSFKSYFRTCRELTPHTILSRISSSFKTPYSHVSARILRSATNDWNDSPSFWNRVLNLCLSMMTFPRGSRFQQIFFSALRYSSEILLRLERFHLRSA